MSVPHLDRADRCLLAGHRQRLAQVCRQLGGRLITVVSILGKQALQDAHHLGRDILAKAAHVRDGIVEVHHHQRHGRIRHERRAPAQHLIQGNPQRIQVRAVIGDFAADQLRRHVAGRPHHGACGRVAVAAQDLDDPKIHQDGLALHVEHDVGGLDVAMDHAALVGIADCIGDVRCKFDGIFDRKLPSGIDQPFQAVLECFPRKELQHHVIHAVIIVEIVHLHDIGMAQARYSRRFTLEALDEHRIGRKMGMDKLDRNNPLQIWIGRLVDRRHASLSEQCIDSVTSTQSPPNPGWLLIHALSSDTMNDHTANELE